MVCALLQVCSSHSTEVTWQFIYICSEECRMEYEKWASPALSFLRILSETPRNVWMNPLIKPPKCTMTAAFLYSNMQAARSSPEMRRELPSLHSFSPAVRWDGAGVLLSFGFSLFFCFFFFFPWWNEVPDSGTNGRTQRCARAQPGGGKWEECAGAGLLAGRERCAQAHALALRTKCMRTESRWGSPRACAKVSGRWAVRAAPRGNRKRELFPVTEKSGGHARCIAHSVYMRAVSYRRQRAVCSRTVCRRGAARAHDPRSSWRLWACAITRDPRGKRRRYFVPSGNPCACLARGSAECICAVSRRSGGTRAVPRTGGCACAKPLAVSCR